MKRGEGGAILIEFALVAMILFLLLGALFDFGRAFFVLQQGQRVASFAARELALLPLPATGVELADLFACRRSDVVEGADPRCAALQGAPTLPRETIFDPDWLAVSCATLTEVGVDCRDGTALDRFVSGLPVVNQMLWPLMIWDRTEECPDSRPCLLRYPGALFSDADPENPTGWRVLVPIRIDDAVQCVDVIEPVVVEPAGGAGAADPFPIERGGLVALRWNFPFQATSLLAGREGAGGLQEPIDVLPRSCTGVGPGLAARETQGPLPVLDATPGAGPHGGPLGLGRQLARGRELLPFRRVLSSEALARRELFL